VPKITASDGPSNAAAGPGEPGFMPEPEGVAEPEVAVEAAPEPPDPTPDPGPVQDSTPPPSSPVSSDPEPVLKPAPKRAGDG
jgi:hypothetical protein